MNQMIKLSAIALALAGMSGMAQADKASSNGGIRVQSDDGKFEGRLGARIHFDGYIFESPDLNGSEAARGQASGTEFRRTRITLRGKAFNWDYILENDFSDSSPNNGYRDVNISTKVGPGTLVIGQFKPYRSMDEMTSSNEITMMERAFSSSAGLYAGRQFQQGLGYRYAGSNFTFNNALYSLRNQGSARNDGVGFSTRFTIAPLTSDTSTLHLGLSYNTETRKGVNAQAGVANPSVSGRRGATLANAFGAANVANLASTVGESIDVLGLEAAYTAGPLFLQSEYARATFAQPADSDQDVDTFYIMGAFNLSGLTKGYNKGNGAFQSIRPGAGGAIELTARYDMMENSDSAASPEVTNFTIGANYYVNANVRFMLNYTIGEAKAVVDGNNEKFEQNQLAVRAQYAF